MNQEESLRQHLRKLLDWQDAHVNFDAALEGVPHGLRGLQPQGLPYSLWQLLEHLRLTQRDILEFCRNPAYEELAFDQYWPRTISPPTTDAWEGSIADFRRDGEALKRMAMDPKIDLFASIPHGTGQTYLRELLLVADHNAYHVGQIITVRRLLGGWGATT